MVDRQLLGFEHTFMHVVHQAEVKVNWVNWEKLRQGCLDVDLFLKLNLGRFFLM